MKTSRFISLLLAALLALGCVPALAEVTTPSYTTTPTSPTATPVPACQEPTKDGRLHGHWYGEWFPTREKHHTAFCRYDFCEQERETSCERITLTAVVEDATVTAKLCPVCGGVDGVRGFEAVAAQVKGNDRTLPQGEPIVRAGEWQGQRYVTVAFEYGGRLRYPLGAVRVTLPAEQGAAYTLYGEQNALAATAQDGTVTIDLPRSAFAVDGLPVALLLVSAQ